MSELSTALEPIIRLFARAVSHELRPELAKITAEIVGLRRELGQLKGTVEGGGKSITQIPSSGTCWTCMWFGGKICQRAGSPYHHKRVSPTDTCEKYLFTENPRGEMIKKVGEPRGINGPGPKRIRLTEICPNCKHEVRVTKTGKRFKHDLDGKLYTGLSGDKNRPCVPQTSKGE